MSAIRSILLHLDATPGSAARLAVAEALAARHGARVTALFGVRSDGVRASYAYSASAALGEAADPQAIEHDFERSRLRGLCDQNGAGFTWCEIFGDTVRHGFLAETAYVDLLILGQQTKADETSGAPAGFVESVILESGVPALVIPCSHGRETIGQRMLLAWDGSPPSARAMRAALPFMAHAAEVHVATWAAHVPTAPYSGVDASAWLNRHGIASQVHQRGPTHHLANELASMVARLDADLVVMGCYGHSRLRERVFGGATRASLASLPVPVLMAH